VPVLTKVEAALLQPDGLAEQAMRRTEVPGIAIAAVCNDQLVYLKGFRVREAGQAGFVNSKRCFSSLGVEADRRNGRAQRRRLHPRRPPPTAPSSLANLYRDGQGSCRRIAAAR
jgi:hypothetical protein